MQDNTTKKRIDKLINTLLQVSRGNYDCEAEISNNFDELDSLAIGMNMLIEDLKKNTLVEAQNIKIKEINQELIIAKEKAEESDRLKSAFLANMSHEIRTPINGILGFAELLKDPNISELEKLSFIEIIETSGLKLLNIINDLIDLSKIESGMEKVFNSEISINEQLTNIYKFFTPLVNKKGLKLVLNKQPDDTKTV
ncbi:MAG: histidine kinase dimerization/phospho-acceptor domain-containing protein [Prolixibacteraceae bacterium]